MKKAIFIGIMACCAAVSQSQAAIVEWTLNNVVLSDGQTLTGGFSFDADTSTYSNISIANSGSSFIPSTVFDRQITPNACSSILCTFNDSAPSLGDIGLTLIWNNSGVFPALSNDGGVRELNIGAAVFRACTREDCAARTVAPTDPIYATVVSGELNASAVPVPAAAWLFLSALGGLAGLRARGKSQ